MQYNTNTPARRGVALQVVLHVAPMQQTHHSYLPLPLCRASYACAVDLSPHTLYLFHLLF